VSIVDLAHPRLGIPDSKYAKESARRRSLADRFCEAWAPLRPPHPAPTSRGPPPRIAPWLGVLPMASDINSLSGQINVGEHRTA
jgi:hypothetical protein